MSNIKIILDGKHSCESVFESLNRELKLPYGHADWDSISDSISVLEWIEDGVDVEIFVKRNFSLENADDLRKMVLAFGDAYEHNRRHDYSSRLMIHLE